MNTMKIIGVLISLIIISPAFAEGPDRSKGISVHALPKRVAKISGKPWGLEVAYAPYLKPEPGQPFLQSIDDVLRYVKKQDPDVIKNGLWVVTTHPSAYSEEVKRGHPLKGPRQEKRLLHCKKNVFLRGVSFT